MSKNLKIAYILSLVLASIIIAWGTLSNYFTGVGVCFVAVLGILIALIILLLTDNFVKSRIKDLFIISSVFVFLEFFVYFLIEFALINYDGIVGMQRYQMIISILAFIFLIYITFRFILDLKDIKISFIETMLGNKERVKKIKTAKELSNGSLEDKPNKKNNDIKNTAPDVVEQNQDNNLDIEIDEE